MNTPKRPELHSVAPAHLDSWVSTLIPLINLETLPDFRLWTGEWGGGVVWDGWDVSSAPLGGNHFPTLTSYPGEGNRKQTAALSAAVGSASGRAGLTYRREGGREALL